MVWNFGSILDGIADAVPGDGPALIHGADILPWASFTAHTNNLGRALRDAGLANGDKVAHLMRNSPAYLETTAACVKARLVHVNVNYRYAAQEVAYVLDNADATAVVYDTDFADVIAELRPRLTKVRLFIEVCDGPPANPFASAFADVTQAGDGAPLALDRSDDDLLFIYTGGTTGRPKGVMWRHEDLWRVLGAGSLSARVPRPADLAEHVANVAAGRWRQRLLVAAPLMHGAGLMMALNTLCLGGTVITAPGSNFDPDDVLRLAAMHRADRLMLIGDSFARPLLQALDRAPGAHDLSALKTINSTGVMWSPEVKAGLLRHLPDVLLVDTLGSSEAGSFAMNKTARGRQPRAAAFKISPTCRVFTEDLKPVEPGSDRVGLVARSGPIPLGYYKDPDKTARTFPTIDGQRWVITGDWARVAADGTLTLLGRGSMCINTGGEKVFAEEVEETLKRHPAIEDALVVGLPDARWGQALTAVVELAPGAAMDEAGFRTHVRAELADYKAPKRLIAIDRVPRQANGKADYATARRYAQAHVERA